MKNAKAAQVLAEVYVPPETPEIDSDSGSLFSSGSGSEEEEENDDDKDEGLAGGVNKHAAILEEEEEGGRSGAEGFNSFLSLKKIIVSQISSVFVTQCY